MAAAVDAAADSAGLSLSLSSPPPAPAAASPKAQQQPTGSSSSGTGARFTAAQDACQSFMSRFQQQKKVDPFAGQASFSIGPLDIYGAGLIRQFRVRQKVDLNDRLSASAGLYYDLGSSSSSSSSSNSLGPWGSLVYKLDPQNPKSKSRIELSTLDRRLLVRKGWEVNIASATVGVSAEARLNLVELDNTAAAGSSSSKRGSNSTRSSSGFAGGLLGLGGSSNLSLRPDLHISLDQVKPLKFELIGIGLVLLLGLPLSLNNKEFEAGLPLGLGRLKGFGRASVKRAGYMSCKLATGEASGVLDLN